MIQSSPIECVIPIDCKAWQKLGIKINGVYPIKPDSGPAFQVYTSLKFYFIFLLTGLL